MKDGTTLCVHGTPTDEPCEICALEIASPTPERPTTEEGEGLALAEYMGHRRYHTDVPSLCAIDAFGAGFRKCRRAAQEEVQKLRERVQAEFDERTRMQSVINRYEENEHWKVDAAQAEVAKLREELNFRKAQIAVEEAESARLRELLQVAEDSIDCCGGEVIFAMREQQITIDGCGNEYNADRMREVQKILDGAVNTANEALARLRSGKEGGKNG